MLGSILFWFPFVRGITASIKQITSVTEKNADEDFTVRVVIEDEGAGVPEEVIDKLFDRFFRVESDRSRDSGGTGLGMAIVKSCIEACGVRVTAKNRNSTGLEIKIVLLSSHV